MHKRSHDLNDDTVTNSDIICEIRSGNEHPEQIVKDAGIYVRNIFNKKNTFNIY